MGFFDSISNQIDKQIQRLRQAQSERAAAEKKWLANPYGMDPEVQKRLVEAATKKREDEMAVQLAQQCTVVDPFVEYEKQLAQYNDRKSHEEGSRTFGSFAGISINHISNLETRKKKDEEFEKRRQQRLAEQHFNKPLTKEKRSNPASSSIPGLIPDPVSFTTIPDRSVEVPPPFSDQQPTSTIPETVSLDASEFIAATIAKIQDVKPLPHGDILSLATRAEDADVAAQKSVAPINCQRLAVAGCLDFLRSNPERLPVAGCLEFLRSNPEFLHMRNAVQQEPALLSQFMQIIAQENPNLALLLYHNEEEFCKLLVETSSSTQSLPNDLSFLETDLNFDRLRKMIQRKPDRLHWAMQQLVVENPYQAAVLARYETQFIDWLNIGSENPIGPLSEALISSVADRSTVGEPARLKNAARPDLSFLRNDTLFLNFRATYQAKPEMLAWLTHKFIERNPHLRTLINSTYKNEFLSLMNEGFNQPVTVKGPVTVKAPVKVKAPVTVEAPKKLEADSASMKPASSGRRSSLSKRKSMAGENEAPTPGGSSRKRARFSDSTIRADNNMYHSPMRKGESTPAGSQSTDSWFNKAAKGSDFFGGKRASEM